MKRILVMVVLLCVCLIGCGKQESTENYDLLAEYAAGILIDHAYVNEDRYSYKVDISDSEKPTDPENPTDPEKPTDPENPSSPVNPDGTINYAAFLGLTQFKVELKGVVIGDEYSPDDIFVINADQGKTFLVVEFDIVNESEVDKVINTSSDSYILSGKNKSYKLFASGLSNELLRLSNKNIAPGQKYSAIMVFHIDDGNAEDTFKVISSTGVEIVLE